MHHLAPVEGAGQMFDNEPWRIGHGGRALSLADGKPERFRQA
jgi:hypothetical protein